jgi:hypothetical protein
MMGYRDGELTLDLVLAAGQLRPSVAENHKARGATLRKTFPDAANESFLAALKLRESLHPQTRLLCEQVLTDPQAASFRGARSIELLKLFIMDLLLINTLPQEHESTSSRNSMRGGELMASFLCITTCWTSCSPCKHFMQRSLLLKVLHLTASLSSESAANLCGAFHPDLGVPLAVFSLYMSTVTKALGVDEGTAAYW